MVNTIYRLMGNFKISYRIWLLIAFAMLALLIVLFLTLQDKKQDLEAAKEIELMHLIETAHSIAAGYYREYQAGNMTEDQAKSEAVEAIRLIRYEGDNYIFVNEKDGELIVHPNILGENVFGFRDANGNPFGSDMVNNTLKNGETFTRYWWNRTNDGPPLRKLTYSKLFKEWGWVINTGIYVDIDLDKLVKEGIKNIIEYGVTVLAFLLGIAFFIGKSINDPINRSVEAMKEIGSGEGDLTVRLSTEGNNELSELAKHFNIFVERIQKLVSEVGMSVDSVASAAEELSASSNQNMETIKKQYSETDQVASAINEMNASVHEVASKTAQIADSVKETSNATSDGQNSASNAYALAQKMFERISESAKTINLLGEESKKISTVLDVIHSIAEQINLLALNAAIEAARAGQAGRGFAVVADEVRSLANRTEDSTNEISGMIERLQSGATEAVTAMESNLKELESSLSAASDVDRALEQITREVKNIDDMMAQIATASEEQAAVTEEVNRNINNIVQLSEESTQSAEHSTTASNDLASLSEKLSGLVKQFRV